MTGMTLLLGCAAVFSAGLMAFVWRLGRRLNNAGIVDVAWAGGFSVLALFYAAKGDGSLTRRALVAVLVTVWSLRLAIYLGVRIASHHPIEDRRYAELRKEWGGAASRKMFWFFQLQGALQVFLSVPFLLASGNPRPGLTGWEWLGAVLWLVAVGGESLADAQLRRFKADPSRRGGVCQDGLWRYSRHPNYFFEWLVWVAFFLLALDSEWGFITILCPLLMLHFLLRVTGIPLTEELAVRSKGEAYRRYQRITNPFFPWFPRKEPQGSQAR